MAPVTRTRQPPVCRRAGHEFRHPGNGSPARSRLGRVVSCQFREPGRYILHSRKTDSRQDRSRGSLSRSRPNRSPAFSAMWHRKSRRSPTTARSAPCWSVMLAFEAPLDAPFDAAKCETGPIGWMARNASKPGRAGRNLGAAGPMPTGRAPISRCSPTWSQRPAWRIPGDRARARTSIPGGPSLAFREGRASRSRPRLNLPQPAGAFCMWGLGAGAASRRPG